MTRATPVGKYVMNSSYLKALKGTGIIPDCFRSVPGLMVMRSDSVLSQAEKVARYGSGMYVITGYVSVKNKSLF